MIKLNLLPSKKKPAKKITELQQQMILGALILSLVAIGLSFYYNYLSGKIDDLKTSKAAAEAKIREQDNMLKEVKTVEDERKRVGDKIALIEQLKKNQTMLVHLLDAVSRALPPGVNLTSLAEKNGQIDIDGTAFTNNDIVRFVDNLKACPLCSEVFLLETAQMVQEGIEIYRYKLQFTIKGV